jgi:hypothetical protein
MVTELQGSLKEYEAAKQSGKDEDSLSALRETTRRLFEEHCIASGLRDADNSYINIDVEFFDGNTLNQDVADTFIKNIMKAKCQQIKDSPENTYFSEKQALHFLVKPKRCQNSNTIFKNIGFFLDLWT